MERKFTDDEIVKALECCYRLGARCVDCPFYGVAGCMSKAGEAFLDFNNRQKAEVERLQSVVVQMHNSTPELIRQVKDEAIKEFAARANEKLQNLARIHMQHGSDDIYFLVSESFIDNVLKEMMGEDNGN